MLEPAAPLPAPPQRRHPAAALHPPAAGAAAIARRPVNDSTRPPPNTLTPPPTHRHKTQIKTTDARAERRHLRARPRRGALVGARRRPAGAARRGAPARGRQAAVGAAARRAAARGGRQGRRRRRRQGRQGERMRVGRPSLRSLSLRAAASHRPPFLCGREGRPSAPPPPSATRRDREGTAPHAAAKLRNASLGICHPNRAAPPFFSLWSPAASALPRACAANKAPPRPLPLALPPSEENSDTHPRAPQTGAPALDFRDAPQTRGAQLYYSPPFFMSSCCPVWSLHLLPLSPPPPNCKKRAFCAATAQLSALPPPPPPLFPTNYPLLITVTSAKQPIRFWQTFCSALDVPRPHAQPCTVGGAVCALLAPNSLHTLPYHTHIISHTHT